QGGSLEEVTKYGLNNTCGLLVNSSRAIIFADNSEFFHRVAGDKAREMQVEMEKYLSQKKLI
ncbi:MAG TPA: orotidine 5'-phosphate decarboxylase, partial [Bacteroidales bacterium]|nr:orotidine 5'-phosphate decarboxylase [Bacteroidales bacterium]